jgi:hypothetical protein
VDRQREHRIVAGEDPGGAVALVHVEVHDRRAADPRVALERAHRHREIVEIAEALGLVGEGVMEPAADVDADAALERLARRHERAAGSVGVGAHDLVGERELGPHGARRPARLLEIVEVVGGVREQQLAGRGARVDQIRRQEQALALQRLEDPRTSPPGIRAARCRTRNEGNGRSPLVSTWGCIVPPGPRATSLRAVR